MNLLVIRLSAMGDVALTLPALRSVLDAHPDLRITVVTRRQFLPFFEHIDRLQGMAAEVRGIHRGVRGLFRLFREIKRSLRPDSVIDLHDVLRSRILSFFFRTAGIPVFRIDKGRPEKKRLTARTGKDFRPLTHTVDRYLHTFDQAGFPATLSHRENWFGSGVYPRSFLQEAGALPRKGHWIGMAPFAKHPEKRWPLDKMDALIGTIDLHGGRIFLFGGGDAETGALQRIAQKYPDAVVVAGALDRSEELGLISTLDLMISMDSANMHLAAISGIPVVSVWGATHPFAGFGPLGKNEARIVQIPHERLGCRPCSVFGNIPCYRGDHACMAWLTPEAVLEKVRETLKTS